MKIGILLGDDIGLEVVPESVKVMKAAAAKTGLAIEWHELPIGNGCHSIGSPVRAAAAFITLTHSGTTSRPISSPSRIPIFKFIPPP